MKHFTGSAPHPAETAEFPPQQAIHKEWVRVSRPGQEADAEVHGYLEAPSTVRAMVFTPDGRIALVATPNADGTGSVLSVPTHELQEGEQPDEVMARASKGRGRQKSVGTSRPWAKYIDTTATAYGLTARRGRATSIVEKLSGNGDVQFLSEAEFRAAVEAGAFADDLGMRAAVEVAFLRRNNPKSARSPLEAKMTAQEAAMVGRLVDYVQPNGLNVERVSLSDAEMATPAGQMVAGGKFNGDWFHFTEAADGRLVSTDSPTSAAFGIRRGEDGQPRTIWLMGEPSHVGFKGIVTPASGGAKGDPKPAEEGGGRYYPTDRNFERAALNELKEEVGLNGLPETLRLLVKGKRDPARTIHEARVYTVDVEDGEPVKEGGDEFGLEATTGIEVPYHVIREHLVWFLENVFTDETTQLGLIELVRQEQARERAQKLADQKMRKALVARAAIGYFTSIG